MTIFNRNFSHLPKWAQEYVLDLQRERNNSVQALNEFLDEQTPSPIYLEDYVGTGELGYTVKRRYLQANRITIKYQGIELTILCEGDWITLQWRGEKLLQDVAFVPCAYQKAKLISQENMRK